MLIQSRDEFRIIESCRLCGAKELKQFINFGDVPLGNNLFDNKKEAVDCKSIPIISTTMSKLLSFSTNNVCISQSFIRNKLYLLK